MLDSNLFLQKKKILKKKDADTLSMFVSVCLNFLFDQILLVKN